MLTVVCIGLRSDEYDDVEVRVLKSESLSLRRTKV